MLKLSLHKSLFTVITAAFLLFNIGLPVVLHYCEMMKTYSSSACDMCHPETNKDEQVQLSTTESSCCKKVIVAEPNKVDFLQAQKNELLSSIQYSTTPIIHSFSMAEPIIAGRFINLQSPLAVTDIPILFSSLLI